MLRKLSNGYIAGPERVNPEIYAVLERCFMSDYLHSRIQAIEVLAKLGHTKHLSLLKKP